MVKRKIIKYLIIGAMSIAALLLFLLATTELTSKPTFCANCHYMVPYVEGWKTSSHADVTCTKCHFPPGFKSKVKGKLTAASMVVNYMTGIYKKSKPWAEISDESCLRSGCHVERLLSGPVTFKEGILFDHKSHLNNLRRGKVLRCTSCHSQIVQGEHISVTETTCFLCHFKNQPGETPINNCDWCHDAPTLGEANGKRDHSFIIEHKINCRKCHGEMQVGDGVVPIERCSSCHAEVNHLEKYTDIDFMHLQHVTNHKVECQNCHLVIQHKSIARTTDIFPDCKTCHITTHKSQLDLFSGIGGIDVPDHPNPMFTGGLNCQACHVYHEINYNLDEFGHNVTANAESCESCHGKGYSKILDQWKLVMNKKLNLLDETLHTTEQEIENYRGSSATKSKSEELLHDAKYNFDLVKKAGIVHNVAYSDELISSAIAHAHMALDIIESEADIPDISIYSTLVPSECKNCHYGMEEITVEAFDIQFSHNIHIIDQKLPCSKCHSNIKEHGETIISKSDCLNCHHTQEIVSCEHCHSLQAAIYSGAVDFTDASEPDIMADEGVECRDCHEGGDSIIRKANIQSCQNCHDEEYGDILNEWQDESLQLINDIDAKLLRINHDALSPQHEQELLRINEALLMIKTDKSNGAHNIELITGTLKKFGVIIDEIPQ